MKKILSIFLSITCALSLIIVCGCSSKQSINDKSRNNNFEDSGKPVIGIAWVPDRNEAFYQNWEYIIQKAGGIPINLDQVIDYDLDYDIHKDIDNSNKGPEGMLNQNSANKVIGNTYKNSNIEYVMAGIDGVFVPGGEDISPTLIKNISVEENTCSGFSAVRDVSDYLLESYCIDKDIPLFSVCRGMQMLTVVSGGEMIQDIPDYCTENEIELNLFHKDTKEVGPKDFVRHDVSVIDAESVFASIVKSNVFSNIPSWHHQCVHSLDGTNLRECAIDNGGSFKVIEAIERNDKTFIMGTQFHPEVVINRVYKQGLEDPCDVNTCLRFFQTLVNISLDKSSANKTNVK